MDAKCAAETLALDSHPDDTLLVREARAAGICNGIQDWHDRSKARKGTGFIYFDEFKDAELKDTFFQEQTQDKRRHDSSIIRARPTCFYTGTLPMLGIRSSEAFPGTIYHKEWTIYGDSWMIPEYVRAGEMGIFASGILHALRGQRIANLIGYYEHPLFSSLLRCIIASAQVGESADYFHRIETIGRRDSTTILKIDDLDVQSYLQELPPGLEIALERLTVSGFLFNPSEIRAEANRLGVSLSAGLESLMYEEEAKMRSAAEGWGISMQRRATEQALLQLPLGISMLDIFYLLVAPESIYGRVQVLEQAKRSPGVPSECYCLIGMSGNAEITLSYAHSSPRIPVNTVASQSPYGISGDADGVWHCALSIEDAPSKHIAVFLHSKPNEQNKPSISLLSFPCDNRFSITMPYGPNAGLCTTAVKADRSRKYENVLNEAYCYVLPKIDDMNRLRRRTG